MSPGSAENQVFCRHSSIWGIGLSVTAFLLITACAVGPDFTQPAAPDAQNYGQNVPEATADAEGTSQHFANDKDVPADWWTLYHSDGLNAQVAEALKANPDLQAAKAALRQAQATLSAGEGALFPDVDVSGAPTREKLNPAAFGQAGRPPTIFTLYNASVNVSYGIDIFGGERREIESLAAQTEAQRFALEAAYLTLTANVVTSAVQEASQAQQAAVTQEIIDFMNQQTDVLNQQFELGGVPKSAVLAQQTLMAQTQTSLPPIEKQYSQAKNQLAALMGHLPSDPMPDTLDLDALTLPEEIPVSLPSKLVEQRPDIRAAVANLHSASAQIGVATANMLPQISLSAGYGSEAVSFGNLLTSGTSVWNLGANVTQPIFHGGTLWYERRAAEAAYDKAAAQYKSTVLAAFQNVADSLRALQYDAQTLAAAIQAEEAANASLAIARAQYENGAVSYLTLLDAERAYQQARLTRVQAKAARLNDTAALFVALGGGWWNKNPASGEAAAQDPTQISSDPVLSPSASHRINTGEPTHD